MLVDSVNSFNSETISIKHALKLKYIVTFLLIVKVPPSWQENSKNSEKQ
jgi:hypothetical protein